MSRAFWIATLLFAFSTLAACESAETGGMIEVIPTAPPATSIAVVQPTSTPIEILLSLIHI